MEERGRDGEEEGEGRSTERQKDGAKKQLSSKQSAWSVRTSRFCWIHFPAWFEFSALIEEQRSLFQIQIWVHVSVFSPANQRTHPGAVLGGANRGQCPRDSESGPPCGPPNRESALIIQWQISCNDFVLKGKAEIKCLSSLLPNQNCWNCKHCFVWMRDLSFFLGCMCLLTKKPAPTWPPY